MSAIRFFPLKNDDIKKYHSNSEYTAFIIEHPGIYLKQSNSIPFLFY